jgi:hypothetical protein
VPTAASAQSLPQELLRSRPRKSRKIFRLGRNAEMAAVSWLLPSQRIFWLQLELILSYTMLVVRVPVYVYVHVD